MADIYQNTIEQINISGLQRGTEHITHQLLVAKLPEIPRLLVLEFRAVVPRVPRAYSALFRGDGNSAFGRSGCADHARNSRIYCADREIAQLLIIGYKYKMCSGYYVSAHSSKVR